ncbi:MAG: lytic transglycosylase domain-containing protein [Chitinophagaceae bacterium]|nr:lytic transglycosylase domain-containing protein [Chitinophagaceae bacterium]
MAQALDNSFYKVKSDTIVIRKGIDPKLYAANLEAAKPKTYKHVPFATDTAYFGEKVPYITSFTEKYLKTRNRTLNIVQDRAEVVFPMIDSVLTSYRIPKELKYLAVIESALNNKARSRVGAVGPWQFMSYTGREMGLVVNRSRDDRKDWVRSTNAAAKYLIELYDELNDWLLVIAAYNSGPRPVLRAIQRTGSDNFWDIKPYLPKETQNHVLAFVSTATIFEKLDYYIGTAIPDKISYVRPVKAEKTKEKARSRFSDDELKLMAVVRISSPLYLELIANELDIDLKQLNRWNYDYELFEYDTYEEDTYALRIPKEKMTAFLAKKVFLEKKSQQIYMAQDM